MDVSIPSDKTFESKLPQDIRVMIRTIMRTAEYRTTETKFQKVNVLHQSEFAIPVKHACTAVGISTKTYYKHKQLIESGETEPEKTPPNQLLKPDEEDTILTQILEAQLGSACLTGTDIRNIAAELYRKRTGIQHVFDRFWSRDFIRRHADCIAKKKCPSVDDDRGSLDREQIEEYIRNVNAALSEVTDLRLVLNMDETGFGRRPDYGKRRSCIFHVNCPIEPVWRSQTDNYHISWIACISAGATYTRPFLVTTRAHLDPIAKNTFISKFADIFTTKKGYQTSVSMQHWIRTILGPYVTNIGEEIGNYSHPVVLIMD